MIPLDIFQTSVTSNLCGGESGSWKTDAHCIWSDTQLSMLILELCKRTPYSLPHLKTCADTHALMRTHAHTHARAHTHTCTHTHAHTRAHTHARAYTHPRTHPHRCYLCCVVVWCGFFGFGVCVCVIFGEPVK